MFWLDESVAIIPPSPSKDILSFTTLPVPCGLKLIFVFDDAVDIKLSAIVIAFEPALSKFATIVAKDESVTAVADPPELDKTALNLSSPSFQ